MSNTAVPARFQILDLVLGMMKTQTVHAAVELKLADLVNGQKTIDDLARETSTQADALRRLFRALASLGIFAEASEDVYIQTDLSNELREGSAMYNIARLHGDEWQWGVWSKFLDSLKTGKPAFEHGETLWSYLASHPESALIFDKAMEGFSQMIDGPLVSAYDFASAGVILDVGCGTGNMLFSILENNPLVHGIFFDQPDTLINARKNERLKQLQMAERCTFEGGDFFVSIPGRADLILLRQIIKDWDDDKAIEILHQCTYALAPGGKILLVEVVILPNGMMPQKITDLQLLVTLPGGKERTEKQFRALIEKAGLHLTRIIPVPATPYSVLEVSK